MQTRWGIAAAVSLVLLAAGCTDVEAGSAKPAPNLAPRALTGSTIGQVMLDDTALSTILGQTLTADPEAKRHIGGAEELLDPGGPASPLDCLGPNEVLNRSSYEAANVSNVARWTVMLSSGTQKVISLVEGVVALPTAAAADALFAKFSDQWSSCEGTTVTSTSATMQWVDTASKVSVENSVLAADVANRTSLVKLPQVSLSMPGAHAIGLRGNCLVEVKIGYIDTTAASGAESHVIDIAHAMMDKVSSLS